MLQWISPRQLNRLGILGMNARNVSYISRYNERSQYPLVDNKLNTKLVAAEAQLNVPELLHVIHTQHEIGRAREVLALHDEFVVKPAQGSGGKGILVIVGRDGDELIKSNGERITDTALSRYLSNVIAGLHSLGGRADVALVEQLVRVSDDFAEYSVEGVPDIRLIVFLGYPVMGMLRLATKASDGKANLHQGAVGVGIDIATGKALSAVQHNRVIDRHPDTGALLSEISIPNWRRLLEQAARCFEVTELGYLGTDMVIDRDRGPMLLELNARPGLAIQVANQHGLKPRLKHVEGLGNRFGRDRRGPDARVAYAMEHFGRNTSAAQPSLFPPEINEFLNPLSTAKGDQP